MISLPISGLQAQWRPSTGHADIVLAESPPGLARRGPRTPAAARKPPTAHHWTARDCPSVTSIS